MDNSAPPVRGAFKMNAMTDAVRTISQLVRTRAIRDGVDLAADGALAERLAAEEVRRYGERALAGAVVPLDDERRAAAGVLAELTGYGALQPFFDDPEVEGICL